MNPRTSSGADLPACQAISKTVADFRGVLITTARDATHQVHLSIVSNIVIETRRKIEIVSTQCGVRAKQQPIISIVPPAVTISIAGASRPNEPMFEYGFEP